MIAVLDYGIGNLRSAEKALQHVGAAARLVDDPDDVAGATGVVLPGVGAFGPCAAALEASGLAGPARAAVDAGVPFLGICVGFQLLYEQSDESPGARGLGVFAGTVRALPAGMKRPQMQWNRLDRVPTGVGGDRPSALLAGADGDAWMYFVHSYAPEIGSETVATCDYGGPVAAAAERDDVWGVQFHPEKSGRTGLALLGRFVARSAPADGPAAGDRPARRGRGPAGPGRLRPAVGLRRPARRWPGPSSSTAPGGCTSSTWTARAPASRSTGRRWSPSPRRPTQPACGYRRVAVSGRRRTSTSCSPPASTASSSVRRHWRTRRSRSRWPAAIPARSRSGSITDGATTATWRRRRAAGWRGRGGRSTRCSPHSTGRRSARSSSPRSSATARWPVRTSTGCAGCCRRRRCRWWRPAASAGRTTCDRWRR